MLTQSVSIPSSTHLIRKLLEREAFFVSAYVNSGVSQYFTYNLYSEKTKAFYKGQTSNLQQRLIRHNSGYEKATQSGAPWELIWSAQKTSKSEAIKLERKLKNLSRKRTLEFITKYSEGLTQKGFKTPQEGTSLNDSIVKRQSPSYTHRRAAHKNTGQRGPAPGVILCFFFI